MSRDHAFCVERYCEDVLDGTVTAGNLVKSAVRRHLNDLENAHERGWVFDAKKAQNACEAIESLCTHVKGQLAGQPYLLSPSQQFILWNIAGWVSAETGYRRFSKAYITCGRKWGKSLFASGLIVWTTYLDDPIEPGGECYTLATTEDQAKLVFNAAKQMILRSPVLSQVSSVKQKEVCVPGDPWHDSIIRPLGSDSSSKDGLSPVLVCLDELHSWRDIPQYRELYEKMTTGSGARRQPITVTITTAGSDRSALWIEMDRACVRMLDKCDDGQPVNDTQFAFIARIDDGDDPFSTELIVKGNPNMREAYPGGVPEYVQGLGTPSMRYLEEQIEEAKLGDQGLNRLLRYHSNCEVSSLSKAIQSKWLQRCRKEVDRSLWRKTFGGLDLSRAYDLSAFVEIGVLNPEAPLDERYYELVSHAWTCRDGDLDLNLMPWRQWVAEERLFCEGGEAVDIAGVVSSVGQMYREGGLSAVAYDPMFAASPAQELLKMGCNMEMFHQRSTTYTEPIIAFIKAIREGRMSTGGCPMFEWSAGNLILRTDRDEKLMPDRENSIDKIDIVVAAIMAFGACMFAKPQGQFHILGG